MKRLFVLIGEPGAGKDTQSDLLQNKLGFLVIRVGELLRELAQTDPALQEEMNSGSLANPVKVDRVVEQALRNAPDSSILCSDGYPRSIAQAKKLDELCKVTNTQLIKVLYIQLSAEQAIERLKLRGRGDDTAEAVRHRIDIFHQKTQPVLDYYEKKQMVSIVEGLGTIDEVFDRIKQALSI